MKNIAKYLKIDHRSTILVYKGNKEVSTEAMGTAIIACLQK